MTINYEYAFMNCITMNGFISYMVTNILIM